MKDKFRKRVFAHAIANSLNKEDLDQLLEQCVPTGEEPPPFEEGDLPTLQWWSEASPEQRHAATLGATMKKHGIQTVEMNMSGGGDSGQLDHFEATPDCAAVPITPFGGAIAGCRTLDALIERIAGSLMNEICPGWCNNDGGEGRFSAEFTEGEVTGTVSIFSEGLEESGESKGKLSGADPLSLALADAAKKFDLTGICVGAELGDDSHTWINAVTRSSGAELASWEMDFPDELHNAEEIHAGVQALVEEFDADSAKITFDLATGEFTLILQNIVQETDENPVAASLFPWVTE